MKRVLLLVVGFLAVVVAILGVLLWASQETEVAERPDLPFAPPRDEGLKDPDHPNRIIRYDLARVEAEHPLTRADLAGLRPAHLPTLNQEEIDQLYARLTAGPIPDGPYFGALFFPRGETPGLAPRLEQVIGGLGGRVASAKISLAEKAGSALWKGKMFYRDERLLRNFVDDFKPLEILIDDPDALPTATVPREGWLKHLLPTTSVWLLFPARLHCGQSLLDGRREAVIIDYAYNDRLPGYQPRPDDLTNRHGLRIRDEIRMVRPGFYLGRAYVNKMFLLNFSLYNPDVAEAGAAAFAAGDPIAEDCWPGEQRRAAAR